MAGDFNPDDKYSYYFGPLSREETNEILEPEKEPGVFLVRDSQSCRGDFVLCVNEDKKISHYIINKIQVGGATRFRIGDQEFTDIPSLLNFYKTHYLDTTSLIRTAPRTRYIAKFDFTGGDPEDLPFKKGDVLELISKDEKEWWLCRNVQGDIGLIPVPYVSKYDPECTSTHITSQNTAEYRVPETQSPIREVRLPCRAVVIQPRIPNLYDRTQLKLEKGDVVIVTKMSSNGQWEGEINGRTGFFPFTHVRLDVDNTDNNIDGRP